MNRTKKLKIFIVDDDVMYLKILKNQFENNTPHEITALTTSEDCYRKLSEEPDIIFLDYYLSREDNAIKILEEIKEISPSTEVVILSGQDSIEVAVNCMKHGAFDYIVKNETSFMRAEKVIINWMHYKVAKKYQTMFPYVIGAIVLVVFVVIMMQVLFPHVMSM